MLDFIKKVFCSHYHLFYTVYSATMVADEESITFRHAYSLNIQGGFATSHDGDSFNTIHGATGYEWAITCGKSRMYGLSGLRGSTVAQLAMEHTQRIMTRVPRPIECTFSVRIVDGSKNEVHPTLSVRGDPITRIGDIGFKAPIDSEVSKLLQSVFGTGPDYKGKTLEIVTVMRLPLSDFALHTEYDRIASAPPVVDDFRFRSIRDISLHDFTIICRNGRVTYPKEALFHVSNFFKDHLLQPTNPSDLMEEANVLAVTQVVDYMLTDTFAHNGEMTADHVRQLFDVSSRYRPMKTVAFKNSIERHLLLQMDKHRDQLDVVVRAYVLACENELPRLMSSALALIIDCHFNQYAIDYGQATSENTANHDIITRLVTRPGIFRPAPQVRLHHMRRSVENVRCLKRYVKT